MEKTLVEFTPTNPNDKRAAGSRLVLDPDRVVAVVAPPPKPSELIITPDQVNQITVCAIWVNIGQGIQNVWVEEDFATILSRLEEAGVKTFVHLKPKEGN